MNKYFFPGLLGLIILGFVGLFAYILNQPSSYESMTSRELLMECTTDMATQFHIHSHITIIVEGEEMVVPANIGIDPIENCMSSVHTHATDGIIHVEAPVEKDFSLGDFFYNWDKPFDSTQVLSYKVDEKHGLKMYVDGKESMLFEKLTLEAHQSIVIDYYNLEEGPGTIPENHIFKANE